MEPYEYFLKRLIQLELMIPKHVLQQMDPNKRSIQLFHHVPVLQYFLGLKMYRPSSIIFQFFLQYLHPNLMLELNPLMALQIINPLYPLIPLKHALNPHVLYKGNLVLKSVYVHLRLAKRLL